MSDAVVESILSRINFVDAYKSLGVDFVSDTPDAKGWVKCWAYGRPHGDSPSAGVNVRNGKYHDFGGTHEHISIFDFCVTYGKFVDFRAARDFYAEQTGVPIPKGRPAARPDEHLQFFPWTEANLSILRLWCAINKPGILPDSVLAAGGRLARYREQFTVLALPIWGYQLLEADPVGWVLWNTQLGNSLLPVFHKDKSISYVKMKTTSGSKPGLIGSLGLQHLAQANTVIKTEGPGDLMSLMGIMPPIAAKIVAVTNANGSGEIPPRWVVDLFTGKTVLTVHDADEPGQIGAARWSEAAARTAHESKNVILPYPIQPKQGRDLRDWIREDGGTWTQFQRLANDAKLVDPPPAGAPKADDDPMRLARVFLEKYQRLEGTDNFTLCCWREDWYRWCGTHWERTSSAEIQSRVSKAVEQELDSIAIEAEKLLKDSGIPVRAIRVTQRLLNDVLGSLRALTLVPDGVSANSLRTDSGNWIKKDWMSVANGILKIDEIIKTDLIGGSTETDLSEFLIPHSPTFFATNSLPFPYAAGATAEFWEGILQTNLEADYQRIAILQEWTGYLLTPDTRYQKFLLLEGEGANGKSVYLGVVKALLGAANVSHVPLEQFGEQYQLIGTLGRLANIAPECGEMDKVAEGVLKSFVGGDSMQFSRKYKEAVESVPTARLIVATNSRPRFADRSDGIWRRMIYMPFRIQIPKEDRMPGLDRAEEWTTAWVDQMPGILNWALEGLRRLRRNERFTESEVCSIAIEEYRVFSNPVLAFLDDYVEESEVGQISANKLYEVYRAWCSETGHRPLANNVFGKEVRKRFKAVVYGQFREDGARMYCYWGIKLREHPVSF